MRVLVCGGRDFDDAGHAFVELDRLHAEFIFTVVIEGNARGADTLAGEWATARGIGLEVYPADWDGLGRQAGLMRNEQMLKEGKPDLVIGFPGKRGTAHMCRLAESAGVRVIRIKRA